jgi:hypothetical protein
VIRKVTPNGTTSFFAGNDTEHDLIDGAGADARFLGGIGGPYNQEYWPQRGKFWTDGNLYVIDQAVPDPVWRTAIRKITPAGVVSTAVDLSGLVYDYVKDLVIGSNGQFIFSTSNIVHWSEFGTDTQATYTTDECVLNAVTSLAIASNGTIFAVDSGTTLYKLAGTPGNITPEVFATFPEIVDSLIVGPQGTVFGASRTTQYVFKVTPEGVVSVFAGVGPGTSYILNGWVDTAQAFSQGALNWPSGMAFTPKGDLLVSVLTGLVQITAPENV